MEHARICWMIWLRLRSLHSRSAARMDLYQIAEHVDLRATGLRRAISASHVPVLGC